MHQIDSNDHEEHQNDIGLTTNRRSILQTTCKAAATLMFGMDLIPRKASAKADCMTDCLKNCKLIAPKVNCHQLIVLLCSLCVCAYVCLFVFVFS